MQFSRNFLEKNDLKIFKFFLRLRYLFSLAINLERKVFDNICPASGIRHFYNSGLDGHKLGYVECLHGRKLVRRVDRGLKGHRGYTVEIPYYSCYIEFSNVECCLRKYRNFRCWFAADEMKEKFIFAQRQLLKMASHDTGFHTGRSDAKTYQSSRLDQSDAEFPLSLSACNLKYIPYLNSTKTLEECRNIPPDSVPSIPHRTHKMVQNSREKAEIDALLREKQDLCREKRKIIDAEIDIINERIRNMY